MVIMCKKSMFRRGLHSKRKSHSTSNSKRYASAIAAAQIGEKPIPVLTGKSAICFLAKALEVEKEMGNCRYIRPAELKAFKNYANSVADMEAESLKFKLK
jgi:hypothetical protein